MNERIQWERASVKNLIQQGEGERSILPLSHHGNEVSGICMNLSSIFNVVNLKGIFRTGHVHVHFRCRRLCARVFTAL